MIIVYGIDKISSGASSDIRQATMRAQAMVKVSKSSLVICIFLSSFIIALGFLEAGSHIL